MAFLVHRAHGRCCAVPCCADTVVTAVTSCPAVVVQQRQCIQQRHDVAPAVEQLPCLQPDHLHQNAAETDLLRRTLQPQQLVQAHTQDLLLTLRQQQQQQQQRQQQHSLSSMPSSVAHGGSSTTTDSTTAPTKQHRKRRKQKHSQGRQQQLPRGSNQQQQQAPCKAPVRYPACGKSDGLKLAGSISRRLHKGEQVLVPAGGGMQLVRSTAMLASARTLLLSSGSGTELVYQPSFSSVMAGTSRQAPQQQQPQHAQARATAVATGQANAAGQGWGAGSHASTSGSDRVNSNMEASTSSSDNDKATSSNSHDSRALGTMLLVSAAPEAQLRRFDRQPLIAARGTPTASLAAAMFARLCNKGFTSVRAAGPEASRLAVLAAAEARKKALGCGLDLAVVPATDYVDVELLPGPEGVSRFREADTAEGGVAAVGPGEELPKQFVRVTVLHLVRCQPQQPWQLLPHPVPQQQRPDVRWARQQQQQQQLEPHGRRLQQQQRQDVFAVKAQQQQQQQQVALSQQEAASVTDMASQSSRLQDPAQAAVGTDPQQQQTQQRETVPLVHPPRVDQGGSGLSNSAVPISWLNGSLQPAVLSADAAGRQVDAPAVAVGAGAGSAWVAAAAAGAAPEFAAADALLASSELGLLQLQHDDVEGSDAAAAPGHGSSCSGVAARPPSLLQHKQAKKGSRQLVAAAHAPGASSSSSGAASAGHS